MKGDQVMNQKRTFNVFRPKSAEQALIQPQIPALVTGLAALLLLALTACVPVSAGEPVAAAAPAVEAAASTTASENEAAADPAFLAANPEVLKVNLPSVAEDSLAL